jgi:hypothetical protein
MHRTLALRQRGSCDAYVFRLYPYYPVLVTIASDGTIWTVGSEIVNGKESGPGVNPADGVLRHFDRAGKMLGSFIPRSTLSSGLMIQSGFLRSGNGRVGWYTGPMFGPGSEYFEVLADGSLRKFPSIDLGARERVDGIALTDNGRTYVTTTDNSLRKSRFLSIGSEEQQWQPESFPSSLSRASLYGGEGNRLIFFTYDRFRIVFARTQ